MIEYDWGTSVRFGDEIYVSLEAANAWRASAMALQQELQHVRESERTWRELAEKLQAAIPGPPPDVLEAVEWLREEAPFFSTVMRKNVWDYALKLCNHIAPPNPNPQTITVNGRSIPIPCYEPEEGVDYWLVTLEGVHKIIRMLPDALKSATADGLLHTTREAAQAHYDALIEPTRRDG